MKALILLTFVSVTTVAQAQRVMENVKQRYEIVGERASSVPQVREKTRPTKDKSKDTKIYNAARKQ